MTTRPALSRRVVPVNETIAPAAGSETSRSSAATSIALRADRDFADVGGRLRTAAHGRDECNLVAFARLEVTVDIFLVDGEAYRIVMSGQLGKFDDKPPPDFADRSAVGKLARQLGRMRPLAQRREQLDRERVHLLNRYVMWPSSGMSSFSIASRHASGEPGSAAMNLP